MAGFGGVERHPTLADKAAAFGFFLATNHGFEDGNKRIGHAAMETFLVLNGHEIDAPVDEQEDVFWRLAAKTLPHDEFFTWVRAHIKPLAPGGGGTTDGA